MPILALLGLIFTIIETALKIAEYLHDHPEVTSEARSSLEGFQTALTAARAHAEDVTRTLPLENNIESP